MYVLGSATNVSAPLRLQNTCAGDGFASLGKAYGVSPQAIIQMQPGLQNRTLTKQSVQAFVKALPGWSPVDGLLPFVASDNPGTVDASGKPEGYAHFTASTQLMLPDMPRLDGQVPHGPIVSTPPSTHVIITKKADSTPWLVGGLVVGGLLLLNELGKKRKKSRAQLAAA